MNMCLELLRGEISHYVESFQVFFQPKKIIEVWSSLASFCNGTLSDSTLCSSASWENQVGGPRPLPDTHLFQQPEGTTERGRAQGSGAFGQSPHWAPHR